MLVCDFSFSALEFAGHVLLELNPVPALMQ
jgi:hypothetical protein